MVEVTKQNFLELFPFIEKSIKDSCFIAIDAEFTGLDLRSVEDSISLFDSLESRYQKLKLRASSFLPCQIGLSMFKRSKTENKYCVQTYIFYVRPYLIGSIDRICMCQASSLEFLCRYDFDFNKFIKEGIPYLNEEEESQVLKEIKEKSIGHSHEKMRDFKHRRELDMLVNNNLLNTNPALAETVQTSLQNGQTNRIVFEKDPTCHEYFLINELRRRYPSLRIYSDNDKIIIEKHPNEKSSKFLSNAEVEEKNLADFHLGFSKVFHLLKASNKPLVGHNLLMDLLLFNHNFHKPLPKTYKEFKKELHSIFPVIFDTRHIWLHVKKFSKLKEIPRQSSLFELFEILKNPNDSLSTLFSPDIEHSNCDKYCSENFPHESGFDSYVTGWIFLKLCHVLAMDKITNSAFIQPQTFEQHLKAVHPFQNRINISRSNTRFINLSEEDPKSVDSHLLCVRVQNRRKTLNHNELSRLFDKYGLIEFKLNKNRKEAILAVGSLRSFREIQKDFQNDPDYLVSKYSRYSSIASNALWLCALGVGTLAACYALKYSSKMHSSFSC